MSLFLPLKGHPTVFMRVADNYVHDMVLYIPFKIY